MKNIFLNERVVLSVIVFNAIIIFIQECGVDVVWLNIIDFLCTLFFVIEICVKISHLGWKEYWKDGWNWFDFIVITISLPSVAEFFIPIHDSFDAIQITRTLRIIKFSRLFHHFPDFPIIVKHFWSAMKKTWGILCAFALCLIVASLICTSLLKNVVPEYFGNPGESIYTIFRMCTIEGWYEVPNAIATATEPVWGAVAKVAFSLVLIMGGIIGMSLVNSIFVDEMVSDNNDDIKEQLKRIEEKLDRMGKN